MEQEWYSVDELSRLLRLHIKTVQRFIREGQIKGTKIGRSWMVHRDELRNYTHAELANSGNFDSDEKSGEQTIFVTTSIVVQGQGYSAAARISTNILGALASPDAERGNSTYTFSYDEAARKATFSFGGTLDFIARIIALFAIIQNNTFDLEKKEDL